MKKFEEFQSLNELAGNIKDMLDYYDSRVPTISDLLKAFSKLNPKTKISASSQKFYRDKYAMDKTSLNLDGEFHTFSEAENSKNLKEITNIYIWTET